MDISKHIYDFLMEHRLVVVPELGSFTIVDKPAQIHGALAIPPSRKIIYDSENVANDGALETYISLKENIDIGLVKLEMIMYYNQFQNKMLRRETHDIPKLGIIFQDEKGNILFDPDIELFKDDTYGLGQTHIPGGIMSEPQQTPFTEAVPPIQEPFVNTPEPVNESAQEYKTEPEPEPEVEEVAADENLFDTGDSTRFRENTERRRPAAERQEASARPVRTTKTPPVKKNQGASGSNTWVLWALLIAVLLGVAGYFGYPYLESQFSSFKKDTVATLPETEQQATDGMEQTTGTETEQTPNPEVAQTLDKATEKKNALNPAVDKKSQSQPAVSQTKQAASQPKAEPKQASASSVGHGKYVLIVGSFTTQSAAETYGKKLQGAGISYEIIDAGNQRFRISVASFDDKTEAFNQAAQFKSKPFCENVWVTRR